MKLEIITQVQLRCQRKKHQNLSHINCGLQIRPDLNPVDYSVWGLLQQKVHKIRITDLDEVEQRLRTEWNKLDHVVIVAANRQWHRR